MQLTTRANSEAAPIRIAVADHNALFRDAFCDCLGRHPRFTVVWTAARMQDALQRLRDTALEVFLTDVQLPDGSAFDLARAVSAAPDTRLAFLSDNLCGAFVEQALRLDASYITKRTPFASVAAMIARIAKGERCFSRDVEALLAFDARSGRCRVKNNGSLGKLTRRQLQVLAHLAQGDSVKEVARKLHLTEKAIDSHKYRIMRTLNVHDRVHLARLAIREGLTAP